MKRRRLNALQGVALAATLAICGAIAARAGAQDHDEALRQCVNVTAAPQPAQAAVDMCTILIESGANTDGAQSGLLWYRAYGYQRLGDSAHAVADLNEAIHLDPRNGVFYETRAAILITMGQAQAAAPDFDKAAQLRGDQAEADNLRCWGRAVAGTDLDNARRFCDRALRLRPGRAAFLDSRGLVGLKQGRFQDAWDDYNGALRWAPEQAQFLFGRGIAALRLGRAADGEADIAAAGRSDPTIADTYATYGITR